MKKALIAILALILALAAGFAARTWLFTAVRISGTSMEDTLISGDVALVARWMKPHRRHVMLCTFPGRDASYVKRVAGLPGDTVEFADGALFLNGRPLSEPYVSSGTEDMIVGLGVDEYFVLGDNRAESYDSRAEDMGAISLDQFHGRAVWILWPLSRFGPVE